MRHGNSSPAPRIGTPAIVTSITTCVHDENIMFWTCSINEIVLIHGYMKSMLLVTPLIFFFRGVDIGAFPRAEFYLDRSRMVANGHADSWGLLVGPLV